MKILILLALIATCCFVLGSPTKDRIRLTDVSVLTFQQGKYTIGRRVAPVLQLKRIGGSAPYHFEADTVQCVNKGHDGRSVQWKCETELADHLKLGRVEVVCEGYDYSEDPNVLVGSCGLEYEVNSVSGSGYNHNNYNYNYRETSHVGQVIGMVIFGVITFVLLNSCYNAYRANRYPGNDNYGPAGSNDGYRQNYQQNSQSNNGSGFWNGFFTGSFLSNVFRPRTYYGSPYRSSFGSSYRSGSSSRTSTSYGGTRGR